VTLSVMWMKSDAESFNIVVAVLMLSSGGDSCRTIVQAEQSLMPYWAMGMGMMPYSESVTHSM